MVNDVTQGRLRRLAAERGAPVLSLFLPLDPTQTSTAPARQSAVDSLLHDARKTVEDGALDHDARTSLRAALDELRGELDVDSLPAQGARGLAVFVRSDGASARELLKLPQPVEARSVLAEAPHVEPLLAFATRERWCVALVDRSTATFFLGDEDGLQRTGHFDDDVASQARVGGMSTRTAMNEQDGEVGGHLRHVAEALEVAADRRDLFDRLLVACQAPLRGQLESALAQPVRDRFAGWLDLDLSAAQSDGDVHAAALPAVQAGNRERARKVLDELGDALGTPGGHGVGGLGAVLAALNERKVSVLLVSHDLQAPGLRDPASGWLGVEGQTPPVDRSRLEEVPDVLPAALALAFEQAADVLAPGADPRLSEHEGIAAITRF